MARNVGGSLIASAALKRPSPIGVYPEVGLKDARDAREGARQTLAQGQDPSQVKKAAKAAQAEEGANTFATIAGELADKKRRDKKAAATLRKFEWFMSFALPALGSRPIDEITAREVLVVLKEVEARGIHETARKLRTAIGDVFRYAIATARAENDPTIALRGALVTPTVTPRAAIVAPKAFGGLLRAIEDYQGAPETSAALELLALTFVRPGELRAAEWAEFDLDAAVWEIPAGRMKMRKAASGLPSCARPGTGGFDLTDVRTQTWLGLGGAVADARLRFDDRRGRGIAFDLGSQLTNEDPEVLRILAMRWPPDRG